MPQNRPSRGAEHVGPGLVEVNHLKGIARGPKDETDVGEPCSVCAASAD